MDERTLGSLAVHRGLVGGPFGSNIVSGDYVEQGMPVIRGNNMGGRLLDGEFVYVTPEKFRAELSGNSARTGDLVFTQRGTLGQVAMVPDSLYADFVVSQSQMRLRVDPSVAESLFVYYACRAPAFLRQVFDRAISTGVPHINLGILSTLTIPLPSPVEQRAIAEVLGSLDDKVDANNRIVRRVEALAVAIMGTAPSTARVGDLARHQSRGAPPASFSPSVALFSLPAFDGGAEPDVVVREEIKSNKFVLTEPVALVSKLNPRISRIWNVNRLPELMAVASTEFVVLAPLETSASALWAALRDPAPSVELAGKVAGTSGSHQRVKPAEVLELSVPDPRELSGRARAEVDALCDMAHAYRSERKLLTATRDRLLPLLMAGRMRVKDAEKVAEEVL